jgi:hypothetical protein
MGNFQKHLSLSQEKLLAAANAYANKRMTVVEDLGTKIVEQLIEADAARDNVHFGDHKSRHEFSNKTYPAEINRAMRKYRNFVFVLASNPAQFSSISTF